MRKIYQIVKNWLRGRMPFIIISVLILMFLVVYLFNRIVVTIHSGEGGVLYKRFGGGTVIDRVFPEGIHFLLPWNEMYIYNVRVQQIAHHFEVLTKNGLKVNLAISIRYFPEYDLLGVLHKKVGPDYVSTVVIPEIEQVLRVLVGRLSAQEVYTTERSIIEKSLNEAIEQVAQRFIIVDDVIIKKMLLPPKVDEAIQNKIEQKHLAEAHIYKIERQKREAERKRIEAGGMKDYNDIVNTSLSDRILQWMAIQAALELSMSDNTKVVVVGSGKGGLPIFGSLILDGLDSQSGMPSLFEENPDGQRKIPSAPVPENRDQGDVSSDKEPDNAEQPEQYEPSDADRER